MKAIILLNGEPYRGAIAEGAYVYCCDGAYKWAKDKVRIDENLGDYDSLPIDRRRRSSRRKPPRPRCGRGRALR